MLQDPFKVISSFNHKGKVFLLGMILFWGSIFVLFYRWTTLNKVGPSKENRNIDNQVVTTPNSPRRLASNLWQIPSSEKEILAQASLAQPFLLYGPKEGRHVQVLKRNLITGNEQVVLTYDEDVTATASGNLWEGLPPNFTLSPSKKKLAFIDQKGLQTLDLMTKQQKNLISIKQPAPRNSEAAPIWSVDLMNGTYSIGRPQWSINDKYISFFQSFYEGAGLGIIDAQTGRFLNPHLSGGYENVTWSPATESYLQASAESWDGTELVVSDPKDPTKLQNLAVLAMARASFYGAQFSADGKKMAFIFSKDFDDENQTLAISDIDGKEYEELFTTHDSQLSLPFFSPNGDDVYFIQQLGTEFTLRKVNIHDNEPKPSTVAVLPSEYNRWQNQTWTPEGYLSLEGLKISSELVLGGDQSQVFLLDLSNKKVIYASKPETLYTAYAGYLEK